MTVSAKLSYRGKTELSRKFRLTGQYQSGDGGLGIMCAAFSIFVLVAWKIPFKVEQWDVTGKYFNFCKSLTRFGALISQGNFGLVSL